MSHGFVRTPFEVKLLILYILAQVCQPVDRTALTELALCDEGVDYFQFSEALASLEETGHVRSEQGLYSITPKGKANGAICESELAYSVRQLCDRNVAAMNAKLRRATMVRAQVLPRAEEDGFTVRMALDDDAGNVMTLEMMAPGRSQANAMKRSFEDHAEQIYNAVLNALLAEHQDGWPPANRKDDSL